MVVGGGGGVRVFQSHQEYDWVTIGGSMQQKKNILLKTDSHLQWDSNSALHMIHS